MALLFDPYSSARGKDTMLAYTRVVALTLLAVASTFQIKADPTSAAVTEIERLGAHVVRDKAVVGRPVVEIAWKVPKLDQHAAEVIAGFANLRKLDLMAVRLDGADLGFIKKLTKLESLRLSWVSLSDADLANLRGLPALRHLDLDGDP